MEYGLQLYSVRDITKNGLENAMKQVAELGYSSVEFAGFFGNSAEFARPQEADARMFFQKFGNGEGGTFEIFLVVTPNKDAFIISKTCDKLFFICRQNLGHSYLASGMRGKLIHKLGRSADEFDLGKKTKKEIRVIKHVFSNDIAPSFDR